MSKGEAMHIRAEEGRDQDERRAQWERLRTLPGFFRLAADHKPPTHILPLLSALQDIAERRSDRLLVTMPPGHAKSTSCSIVFPAWHLFTRAKTPLITASHTHELAAHFGRRVRNIFHRDDVRQLTGCDIADDSASAARFALSNGSDLFAVGVGGAITGRRGAGAIVDDPIRGIEDAESERVRTRTYDWFRADLETRLLPGGWIVLVQTRWHEDDLAGRLLQQERERWRTIEMPAISDDGRPLWPEMYSLDHLVKLRGSMPARMWSSLYQQNPTPQEGTYFTRGMIHLYDELPETARMYGASDFATTPDEGDYTVHGAAGWDGTCLYVHDVWRRQSDIEVGVSAMLDMAIRYATAQWADEGGMISRAIMPTIERLSAERGAQINRTLLPAFASKDTRAITLQGLMGIGRVKIRAGQPWTEQLISELLSFPAGRHDDQVDMLSNLARITANMTAKMSGVQFDQWGYSGNNQHAWMS